MNRLDGFDVVVIGAGVFGLASALELARRGKSVAVVDRFGSGHPATSSTGRSRGIRIAYDHPFYVGLARDAIVRWKALEQASGRSILHLTGQVDFGGPEKLGSIAAAVRSAGGTIEELDGAGLRRHLPELDVLPGESGLFHPDAGAVLSDEGLAALGEAAVAAGVTIFAPEQVLALETGLPARVVTDQRSLQADTIVVAAGPWTGGLLKPHGIDLPLAPAVAQVTFLDAPLLVNHPGIGEWGGDGAGGVYGHPVPGIGYKIAFSTGQEGWLPDVREWQPELGEQARLLAWLSRRLPSFPRKITRTQRHPWTMTPDGDFIVDRQGPIVLACGCSGHAFKFGPALGPLVADVVEGKATAALLRLDRPSLQSGLAIANAPITR